MSYFYILFQIKLFLFFFQAMNQDYVSIWSNSIKAIPIMKGLFSSMEHLKWESLQLNHIFLKYFFPAKCGIFSHI